MFGIFNTDISIDEAKARLKKLDKRRAKLLKIINGHIVYEDDISDGINVTNDQSVTYVIRSEGFGLYNLYSTEGFMQSKILTAPLSKYFLAEELNSHNFRILR